VRISPWGLLLDIRTRVWGTLDLGRKLLLVDDVLQEVTDLEDFSENNPKKLFSTHNTSKGENMPFSPPSFPTLVDVYTQILTTIPPNFTLRISNVPCLVLSAFASGYRGGAVAENAYTHVLCFPTGTDIHDAGGSRLILPLQSSLGDFIALAGHQPQLVVLQAEKRNQGTPQEYLRVYCVKDGGSVDTDF
jgi:hypothetical protein